MGTRFLLSGLMVAAMSITLTGAGGPDPVLQALLNARYEEFTMSGAAGANEVGIIQGITLTQINAPGTDGAGSRTFIKASAQQLRVDDSAGTPGNLRCLVTDFGFAVKFTTSGTKAGMQIICTSREVPVSGDLHYLLRTEVNAGNRDLWAYVGLGSAATFTSWLVKANLADGPHHYMLSFDTTTKEARDSIDGETIQTRVCGNSPTNSTAPFFGLGGVGAGEDYQGSIDRFTLWRVKPPDAWFPKDRTR